MLRKSSVTRRLLPRYFRGAKGDYRDNASWCKPDYRHDPRRHAAQRIRTRKIARLRRLSQQARASPFNGREIVDGIVRRISQAGADDSRSRSLQRCGTHWFFRVYRVTYTNDHRDLPMNISVFKNQDPFLVRFLQHTDGIDTDKLNQLHADVNARAGVPIETVVAKSGLMNEQQVAEVYASHYLLPVFDPPADSPSPIDPEVARLLPYEFCRDHRVVPLSDDGKTIEIAVCTPDSLLLADEVRAITQRRMCALFAPVSVIDRIITTLYACQPEVDRREKDQSIVRAQQSVGTFVIEVLRYATETGASDVHFEPNGQRSRVRLRIGGVLEAFVTKSSPPIRSVVDYIKSRSKMDVSEHGTTQAGFLKVRNGNQRAQFRVRTCLAPAGEKLVVRLLQQNQTPRDLSELGFSERQLHEVKQAIDRRSGLVLTCGPARSGRTTTLYSCLGALDESTANIYTVENSIQWQLPGAHQIQTQDKQGFDIASALEACGEQDPDTIMVDEIPTPQVAHACAQIAMQGQLVFSSLAARDAFSCVSHLLEMGIRPTSLADSLRMVIAQRLVRKLCAHCKAPESVGADQATMLDFGTAQTVDRSIGCERCRGTGYLGQLAVFEVVTLDDRMRSMIQKGASIEAIRHAWIEGGGEVFSDHARQRVLSGDTSIQEIRNLGMSR